MQHDLNGYGNINIIFNIMKLVQDSEAKIELIRCLGAKVKRKFENYYIKYKYTILHKYLFIIIR